MRRQTTVRESHTMNASQNHPPRDNAKLLLNLPSFWTGQLVSADLLQMPEPKADSCDETDSWAAVINLEDSQTTLSVRRLENGDDGEPRYEVDLTILLGEECYDDSAGANDLNDPIGSVVGSLTLACEWMPDGEHYGLSSELRDYLRESIRALRSRRS